MLSSSADNNPASSSRPSRSDSAGHERQIADSGSIEEVLPEHATPTDPSLGNDYRTTLGIGTLLVVVALYAMLMLQLLYVPPLVVVVVSLLLSTIMFTWSAFAIRREIKRFRLLMQRPPTRGPRRFQYGLRTLLFIMLVASLGLSWFATRLSQARRQRELVEAIKRTGGSVQYDYQMVQGATQWPPWLHDLLGDDFFGTVMYVDFSAPQITDDAIDIINNFPAHGGLSDFGQLRLGSSRFTDNAIARLQDAQKTHIANLTIDHTQITDVGLQRLSALPDLIGLDLDHTPITETGLKHLNCLAKLGSLSIRNTQFSDAALPRLSGVLSHLVTLDLPGTQITDAGLEQIVPLKRITFLNLSGTQITDMGLKHLANMPQLAYLELAGTRVTKNGLDEFRQRLPKCQVLQ